MVLFDMNADIDLHVMKPIWNRIFQKCNQQFEILSEWQLKNAVFYKDKGKIKQNVGLIQHWSYFHMEIIPIGNNDTLPNKLTPQNLLHCWTSKMQRR